jgi:hypothetical protein
MRIDLQAVPEMQMSDFPRPLETVEQRDILGALRAFGKGDFSVRMPLDLTGVQGEIADAFNRVVELNQTMTRELGRVRDQVGREGRIDQRVRMPAAPGSWADGLDSINALIGDLVRPTSEVARVMEAVAKGNLSQSMVLEIDGQPLRGEFYRIGSIVNTMVGQLGAFASEVSRVAREVGTEGKLGGQAQVPGVAGIWKDLTDNVNLMAANLTGQVRNIAEVTTAVANGDLSKKITVDVEGEILELKSTINTMVDQLNAFASEVSRVAREVGTEGKLGGQAQVPGVAGTWKDLTDNVNSMAANLTSQVRGIAEIVTAVAHGDLHHKLVFEAKGEIAALADTINGMIDTLATFGDQVTNVAREVGIEGKLGGQAQVPGAAGLWRGVTDNVNQLAANLTTQVRAIAEVATAVANGDLTRSITVKAKGEVAALKDNINEMIRNLADTTRKNTEEDWLKTNLARFSRTLQGHRDLVAVSKLILSELAPLVQAQQGVIYTQTMHGNEPQLELVATYACKPGRNLPQTVRYHENLIGQCAYERKRILLNDMPRDYIEVSSGLGFAGALSVIIMPVLFEGQVKAVIELASFKQLSDVHVTFLEQLAESIGIVFNTIEATMRTENLLEQSQSLTRELQSQQAELTKTNDTLAQQAQSLQQSEALLKKQQEELRQTNEQLQEKAEQLSEQMKQVEYKNKEVELAKAALEEKAEQLALSSRYKSEFLTNMSHELRTPLNSLLILAQLLTENVERNLTSKQIEYAHTIFAAGKDLLALINDVLDLAKVESGTITLSIEGERFSDLRDYVERAFREVAQDKGLAFTISMDPRLPPIMQTDVKRLQQILKNLLSNAFKFTAKGSVSLEIGLVTSGWTPGHAALDEAETVVAFSVIDSGIGIPPDKQRIIFEAFQQADGTTSRQFGGTGLGLSISSELARLLGGEIGVESYPGKGSRFSLYLPLVYRPTVAEGALGASAAAEQTGAEQVDVERFGKGLMAHVSAEDPQDRPSSVQLGAGIELPLEDDAKFADLSGRKVLVVDDDIRNLFALASALEEQGMVVLTAENGLDSLEILKNDPDIDIVLMDLMMPERDGYDTIRVIRDLAPGRQIPIIGVTAKAMKGDREKCIQAGASDYIAKPVNVKRLLSMMRRWLAS